MPIYAYACTNCEEELEKLQKISDPRLVECPHCHQQTLERQLTAPNFRLSGSGWYETDFKNDKDKKKNLSEYDKGKDQKDASTSEKKDSGSSGDTATGDSKKVSSDKKTETKTASTTSTSKPAKPSDS